MTRKSQLDLPLVHRVSLLELISKGTPRHSVLGNTVQAGFILSLAPLNNPVVATEKVPSNSHLSSDRQVTSSPRGAQQQYHCPAPRALRTRVLPSA